MDADEQTIPQVHDFLEPHIGAPQLAPAAHKVEHRRATIDPLLGPSGIGPDEDVGIVVSGYRVPVGPPDGLVRLTGALDVLLRHRLLLQAELGEGAVGTCIQDKAGHSAVTHMNQGRRLTPHVINIEPTRLAAPILADKYEDAFLVKLAVLRNG